MLAIKDDSGRWKTWHVNMPLPDIDGRVVTFQADGHELELFLIAMNMNFTHDGKLVPFKPGE